MMSKRNDTVSRQAAIDTIYGICNEAVAWLIRAASEIEKLPSAQPEITDEQAIEHLQSTGWMQSHDRILTQSTWDIIRCKDCKYGDTFHKFDEPDMPMKCLGQHYGGTYPDDFCSYAERRTDNGN